MADDEEPTVPELRRLLATLDPADASRPRVRLLLAQRLPDEEFGEAIEHGEAALAAARDDPSLAFDSHVALAFRYEDRWSATNELDAVDLAIRHLAEVAPYFESAFPLTMLGRLLLIRFEARESEADIEEAIGCLRVAYGKPDADDETRALLGLALELREDGEQEALPLLLSVIHSEELDEPLLDLVTHRLSRLHFGKHVSSPESLARLAELNTAIHHARSGDLDDHEQAFDLARMLDRRYGISAVDTDRRDAIALFERVLGETSSETDVELCASRLSTLYSSFCHGGDPAESAAAIAKLEALRDRVRDEDQLVRLALAEAYSLRRSVREDDVARLITLLDELPDEESFVVSWRAVAHAERALTNRLPDEELDRTLDQVWTAARAELADPKALLTVLVAGAHVLARRHRLETGEWTPLDAFADFGKATGRRELARLREWAGALPAGTPGHGELLASAALLRSYLCGPVPGPDAIGDLAEQRATIEELSGVFTVLHADDPLRWPIRLQLAVQGMNRSAVLRDPRELEPVLHDLRRMLADCPPGHPVAPVVKVLLGTALLHRHNQFDLPVDLAEVRELLVTADPDEELDDPIWAMGRFTLARTEVLLGFQHRDHELLNRGVARHEEILGRLPIGDTFRHDAVCGLAWSLVVRSLFTGDAADVDAAREHLRDVGSRPRDANAVYEFQDLEQLEMMIGMADPASTAKVGDVDLTRLLAPDAATSTDAAALLAKLRTAITGNSPYAAAFGTFLDMLENARTANLPGIHDAVAKLRTAADHEAYEWQTNTVMTTIASMASWAGHQLTGDPAALDEAVRLLEESLAGGLLDLPLGIGSVLPLAEAWWQRGTEEDLDSAAEAGILVLRHYARQILIQRSLAECTALAAAAAGTALDWARRCLGRDRPDAAFAMLEIGRTLRLHAAADMPPVLREVVTPGAPPPGPAAGRAATSAIAGDPIKIPDDLRRQALDSGGAPSAAQWPPTPDAVEVGGTLRELGLDHLVYLVPGGNDQPGYAVHVSRAGELGTFALPELGSADRAPASVGAACEWAWHAAMGSLTGRLPEARRIALVPCGGLDRIPWHAAREPGGRFLPERLQVTYAATAHQLGTIARRPVLSPARTVTFVADGEDAGIGEHEARYLAALRPQGRFFGHPSWDGTATAVSREALTEALLGDDRPAVLHLACHAKADADPLNAMIGSGEAAVSVMEMLTSASRSPELTPGGLVVAAACEIDLGGESGEGLSIATALLATGACSVIGTKWRVSTYQTAVLMCFLHHALISGSSPAEALHATQLWALDPNRTPLDDLPAGLRTTEASPDLAEPRYWAAFTHHGR